MKKFIFYVILIILLLTGCSKRAGKSRRFKDFKRKSVNVKVDTISYKDLKSYLEFSAQPEGVVDITLNSQTSGTIKKIYKKMGDEVKENDVIAETDNQDLLIQTMQAKASVESANQTYKLAKKNYETNKKMFNKGKFISEAELMTSESKFKSAEAALNMATANYQKAVRAYNNSKFLAPKSGYINYIYIKEGQVIAPGKPVCQIVNPDTLIIKTGVSQNDISSIKIGQKVMIYKGKNVLYGTISAKGVKPIDGANYPIEIKINNPDKKILPGMIVKVKILKNTYKNVIALSSVEIMEEFGRRYVYLAKNNKAIKHFIEIGKNISDNYIVTKGLKPGDKVICQGLENLDDNSDIKIINGSE